MIVSIIVALGWGAFFGYRHDGMIATAIGAMFVGGYCFWTNREGFEPTSNRFEWLLGFSTIYAFLTIVAFAISASAYALAAWLHR